MALRTGKKLIKEFCRDNPVTAYLDCIQYIEKIYESVKAQSESYSYIQFATDLGFSGTNVIHQIVRGYRKLTLKSAKKICIALDLKSTQKKYFETLVEYRNEISGIKRDEIFTRLVALKMDVLESEQDRRWLEFFSVWYHPIVLEVLQLDQCRNDLNWIASQVNPSIKIKQVEESVALLENLGLIEFDAEANRYKPQKTTITSGHEVTGIGFIRYHQRMIELAKDSITRVSHEQRDISSVTFSCDEQTLQEVKTLIHDFNEALQARLESVENKKKVVQLNVQLFPVSHLDN
ncbi:TIGR02147 family protein [Pseudobacteriovorax antillogorgiicola]|uniref:TIGR02147 family protein n=1 Tax=Pseudobacteriovorax antillogorgiicola TaxID=1513793 RepID=A0A1Y6BLZ3_9BACT|nr:TIGR02147 family protein [Pseudobacteriovorax antillogorgiicola]TCS54536.1 uncharacterized protein (TIGR02147 family) [Pseudobacteriovorax antillogorgiicola]SMF18679.1 TIGR02147 family protein [Pseudobacteriovorax antillogorgiicola]